MSEIINLNDVKVINHPCYINGSEEKNYKDDRLRKEMSRIMRTQEPFVSYGWDFIDNIGSEQQKYEIDLRHSTIPNFGMELEQGTWGINFWAENGLPYKSLIINKEGKYIKGMYVKVDGKSWYDTTLAGHYTPTLNMPYRKRPYWMDYIFPYNKTTSTPIGLNLAKNNNLFARVNGGPDMANPITQIFIVRPEYMRSIIDDVPYSFGVNNNNGKLESWFCFQRHEIEQYNLINGVWVQETRRWILQNNDWFLLDKNWAIKGNKWVENEN